MAILFPHWATPILDVYNLPWPDIDEDSVVDLGTRVAATAEALETFVDAVHGALATVASKTDSEAFSAYVEEWQSTSSTFITPITGVAELALPITQTAHAAITLAKTSIIGVLTAQMASTFAGGPVSAAVQMAAREVIEAAVQEAVKVAAAAVMTEINEAIEGTIITPLKNFVAGAVKDVSFDVKQVVVDATPAIARSSDRTVSLMIDVHDVTVAAEKIKGAYSGIQDAVGKLAKWQAGSGFSSPAPYPDPLLREILKPVLDHLVETVHNEVNDLGHQVIEKLAQNLLDTWERLSTADSILDSEAKRLMRAVTIPPPNKVMLVDRSSLPDLITIQRAAAPVVTGAGESDARNAIQEIVIERAPAAVVTGPGESAAREQIQEIVIERAPEPVITGPADSDARERIQEIILPHAQGR